MLWPVGQMVHKCRAGFTALLRRQHRVYRETCVDAMPHELLLQLPNLIDVLVNRSSVYVVLHEWPDCLDRKPRAFRVLSALWRILHKASDRTGAGLVLVDVGPNLGAFNRAALVTADYVVAPLAPDLYSLQGLRNLGPTLRRWQKEWAERRERSPVEDLELPKGTMQPIGYIVMQHAVRLDRPVKAYSRWIERIPQVYRQAVLNKDPQPGLTIEQDRNALATLKHYRSLMPLAQEARKPMFHLRAADGAIGGHAKAVQDCYNDFRVLASTVAERSEVALPGG
jgi:cellulose biosynthesis protein BcsQ